MKTETHCIWTFFGPVILVFLTNIGYLIMTAVIMWRQQKKRNINKKSSDFSGMLEALIALTVVMGSMDNRISCGGERKALTTGIHLHHCSSLSRSFHLCGTSFAY